MYFLLGLWLALAQQYQIKTNQASKPNANPAQQADLKPATVRGRVVAADTGEAVRFARVTLRLNAAATTTFSASADANGMYEIRNVDPGNYSAMASKSGFVTRNYSHGNNFAPLQLAEAQEAKDVNFTLPRAAVISGSVLDDRDEPVPHANVFAMARVYSGMQMSLQQRANTTTDDRGQFRLHDLPAGRYYVQVSYMHNGTVAPHYAVNLYPNATRLADAQSIKLAGGEEVSGMKMALHETAVYSVSGSVIDDAKGTAVSSSLNVQPEDYSAGGSAAFVNTKPDGTFRMNEVTPGRYRVFINMREQAPGSSQNRSVTRALDVSDHNIDNMVFHVGPGSTLNGRVIADGGDLPPSLQLQLISRDPGGNMMGSRGVGMQGDGTFQMQDLGPGHYELIARANGVMWQGGGAPPGQAKQFFVRTISVNNQDVTDIGVAIPEQTAALEVTVTLDFHVGLIAGHVYDPSGNPLGNTTIAVIPSDPKKRSVFRNYFRSQSDPHGQFVVPSVTPGDYLVFAYPGNDYGALFDPDLAAAVEKLATSVSVSPDATASLDLRLNSDLLEIVRNLVPEP